MNPRVFRAYDIRGRVDPDLSPAFVRSLGRAFGTLCRRRGHSATIAVGRDARPSSAGLRDALCEGLHEAGCGSLDVGLVPTPLLYFAVHNLAVGGGLMVTGSHNPPEDNGFKLMLGHDALHGADIRELRSLIEAQDFDSGGGRANEHPIVGRYLDRVLANARFGPRRLSVVIDAGNGPSGPLVPGLLRALGVRVHELYCELDGTFPNHHPDPTQPENLVDLQREVVARGADLGVAYDGDGDRVGVIDDKGRIIWGDELMVVLSRALLRQVPGAAIVAEVKCSQRLFDDIAAHGGRPVMSRVGHSLIKDRMKAEGAMLAGEMSGHIFYKHRWYGFDDAAYTTTRLLEILSHHDGPLSELLADLPPAFSTPELRVHCPDEIKFAVVERVTRAFRAHREVIDIDGVRVSFEHGWGLVRASNTGPVLVLRAEADSERALAEIRAELEAAVRRAEGEVSQ